MTCTPVPLPSQLCPSQTTDHTCYMVQGLLLASGAHLRAFVWENCVCTVYIRMYICIVELCVCTVYICTYVCLYGKRLYLYCVCKYICA